MKYNIVKNKL